MANFWNLIAAVLSTVAALIVTVAILESEHSFVNMLSAVGSGIGVLAGIAWTISAAMQLKKT